MRNLCAIYAQFMHNLCTRLAQFTHEFCTPSAHFSTLQHTGVREPVPCGTPGGQPRGRRRPFFPCSPSLSRNKNRPLHFGILTSDPQLRPMSGTARVATIMHAGPWLTDVASRTGDSAGRSGDAALTWCSTDRQLAHRLASGPRRWFS